MIVSVHLRAGFNRTNWRSECIARALEDAGNSVVYRGRGEGIGNADLMIQTGFGSSSALMSAIDTKTPYIIMEAPVFRSDDLMTYASWGYNGLMGGAWRPDAPTEEREKPILMPEHGGGQLIIGQKPTDHSLRGTDHVDWIVKKRLALPEADFRPHPLMVGKGTMAPIEEALRDYGEVFTYSSTVGTDAVVAGCKAFADSEHSPLRSYTGDREAYIHDLSWWQAHHTEYHRLVPHILSGYDEARARMAEGHCELPRGRVDGQAITRQYYKRVVPRAHGQGA